MGHQIVGKAIPRVDAREKATGEAAYIDDISIHGMLYGAILRSPYPHARILNIDTSAAARVPGVKAVATAKDLPGNGGGLMGPMVVDEPTFAVDRVRFVGEPVAAVAATDLLTAENALNLIRVDYEELQPVFDPIEAMKPGAPIIHPDLQSYHTVFDARRRGNVCSHTTLFEGDVEQGFRQADIILEETFTTPMLYQAYIEPYGAIAQWDAQGRVTIWSGTQAVFVIQDRIHQALKMPMSKIRVMAPRVGGGFGGKVEANVQPHCAVLAKKTGKAVKIIVPREQDFLNSRPRHPTVASWKLGLKKDGSIIASQMSCIFDTGSYADDGPAITAVGIFYAKGPYRVPNVRMDGYCVYTNKLHTGAFRGFGNTQTTFSRESLMDMAAKELGMDPVDFRMRNAMDAGDHMLTVTKPLQSIGYKECLSKTAAAIDWKAPKKGKFRGKGLAGINHCGGMSTVGSVVRLNEDGTIAIQCGAMEIGQGSDTLLCQIVAEELGVPMEEVGLYGADTAGTPYTWATCANRLTYTAGNSVRLAAKDAKKQMLDLAASVLGEEDLEIKEKKIYSRHAPSKSLSYYDLGKISCWEKGGPLIGKSSFMVEDPPFDASLHVGSSILTTPYASHIFGCQGVEIEVDTETGEIHVLNAAAAHDCGKAINPRGVEGQIEGGFAQGLGMALSEAVTFNAKGAVTNPNFTDYKVPAAADMPPLTPIIVEAEDETGPFGAKGLGEAAIMGAAPAIANALYDAVGIRLKDLPMTPEKVLKALAEQKSK
jgi:carbon-monoxide dehydrogenase large subunit